MEQLARPSAPVTPVLQVESPLRKCQTVRMRAPATPASPRSSVPVTVILAERGGVGSEIDAVTPTGPAAPGRAAVLVGTAAGVVAVGAGAPSIEALTRRAPPCAGC